VPASSGKSPIVKATLTGTGKRKIMLIAHMDTVYPAGILKTQPIREDGNRSMVPASPTTRAASR
jgi:glutamate carboxypeptidase